jgi:hypothetical protein
MICLVTYWSAAGSSTFVCRPLPSGSKSSSSVVRDHVREIGDVLDPVREPLSALERQRNAMTPLVFSAQFQQSPIPLEGNLIKRDWTRYFKGSFRAERVIIS